MTHTKLHGRDLKEFDIDLDNIDELLEKLTPEELKQLEEEIIDPDDSCLPPSERCRYRLDKAATGPFDRKALVQFLETKAKEEKDWEEAKPFLKEIRGKVWKPKETEKINVCDGDDVETEWDEVLANATEEELVDLAAILGFHGMLNQIQYHQAFVEGKGDEEGEEGEKKKTGFCGIAKFENLKLVGQEPPNDTDVEASLEQIKDNDAKLKELNLNNIKNISLQRLQQFAEALKTNTNLEALSMANVRATDKVGRAFAEALKENKTLKTLNMESNYISGETIVLLLEAINVNQVVTEFKITNQRPSVMGNQAEAKIAKLMGENHTLLKFGIFLGTPDSRIKMQQHLQRNYDAVRKQRVGITNGDKDD